MTGMPRARQNRYAAFLEAVADARDGFRRIRSLRRAAIAGMLAAACGTDGHRPDATFTIELPPGEGIPVLEAVGDSIVLHAGPSSGTPMTGALTGSRGRILPYDSARYVTLEPGAVVATDATEIVGYNHGATGMLTRAKYYEPGVAADTFPIAAGDTVEFLQHRAEGTCFIRRRGEVIDARECPAIGDTSWTVLSQPATELWFRLAGEPPRGWVKIGEASVRIARRTF